MSYALMLAQVKTILEGVTNIGQVHDSIRIADNPDAINSIYKATISTVDQVRVWMITRSGVAVSIGPNPNGLDSGIAVPTGKKLVRHEFLVEGFTSFKDNTSEVDWQTLVDAVVTAMAPEITLNDTALLRGPVRIAVGHSHLGDMYCHYARITFNAVEWASVTPS